MSLLDNASDSAPLLVVFFMVSLACAVVKPSAWSMSSEVSADASSILNASFPVLSLVRIRRLSVLETDIMDAVTPVASVPELTLLIAVAMSSSESVVSTLIALPFTMNSPEISNAVS